MCSRDFRGGMDYLFIPRSGSSAYYDGHRFALQQHPSSFSLCRAFELQYPSGLPASCEVWVSLM